MTDEERWKRFGPTIQIARQLIKLRHKSYSSLREVTRSSSDSIISELSEVSEIKLELVYPMVAMVIFGGIVEKVAENPTQFFDSPEALDKAFGKDFSRQFVFAVAVNLAFKCLDQMLDSDDEEFLKRVKSYVHIAWIMGARAMGGADKNKKAAYAARPFKRLDAKPGVIVVTDIEEEGEALRLRGVARADAVKKLAEEHRVTLQHVRRQLSQNGWGGRKKKDERTPG